MCECVGLEAHQLPQVTLCQIFQYFSNCDNVLIKENSEIHYLHIYIRRNKYTVL